MCKSFTIISDHKEGIENDLLHRGKADPLAVHGIFDSLERAERHLIKIIPVYVERGYFMNKSLKADSFEIIKNREGIENVENDYQL